MRALPAQFCPCSRCAALHGALLRDDCCVAADLGVLFCLDADRDGMVTLSEMRAFMLMCAPAPPLAAGAPLPELAARAVLCRRCSEKAKEYKAHDFQRRLAAHCATE